MMMVLLAYAVADVSAAVLCAKPRKDGTFSSVVRAREQCRPKERQLEIGAQGPQGEKGDPGPQGAPGGPTAIDCQMVTVEPGCPGTTPSGNEVCAAQAPGKTCVATYLAIFTQDIRDARACVDVIDACAISGNNLGGARVLCCSLVGIP
jgi:hypothetical protein